MHRFQEQQLQIWACLHIFPETLLTVSFISGRTELYSDPVASLKKS